MKLDKKDKQLLSLLYLDSRQSFTKLGKALKLSSSSVERRFRHLKETGIISLLFADVNLVKLGLKSYRLYFKFDVIDKKTENEVLKLFESFPRTVWGVVCEGEYDVIWRIIAKDELEVENTVNLMTERFGKRIVEKTVVTTTYQTYLSWDRVFDGERHPDLPLERITQIETLDEADMKLLAALYGNARATTVELATLVSLTPDAVQYRIRKLVEGKFILGYTAWYDARKLGMEYYKILISFRGMTTDKEKKFLDFCRAHKNVIFLNKNIGSWDMEVDVVVKDISELHHFILGIKTEFGQMIGTHAYLAAIEERMPNPMREYLSNAPPKK